MSARGACLKCRILTLARWAIPIEDREDLSRLESSPTMSPMRGWLFSVRGFGLVAAVAVACLCASARAQPTDIDFAAARDAYRAGDSARLERIAPRLKGHILEPYVEYWRLKLGLDDADPESVRAFLHRYASMPIAERLRADWLKSLGSGKR